MDIVRPSAVRVVLHFYQIHSQIRVSVTNNKGYIPVVHTRQAELVVLPLLVGITFCRTYPTEGPDIGRVGHHAHVHQTAATAIKSETERERIHRGVKFGQGKVFVCTVGIVVQAGTP